MSHKLTPSGKVLLIHRHRGLLQRVAERCKVHPSLVSRVFHGKAKSARVERELEVELSKIASGTSALRKRGLRRVKPVDRSRELRWLAEHQKEYAGLWVALDGGRLIASSRDAKDVFEAARNSGVQRPLIHQVEPPDAPPFGGW